MILVSPENGVYTYMLGGLGGGGAEKPPHLSLALSMCVICTGMYGKKQSTAMELY